MPLSELGEEEEGGGSVDWSSVLRSVLSVVDIFPGKPSGDLLARLSKEVL